MNYALCVKKRKHLTSQSDTSYQIYYAKKYYDSAKLVFLSELTR